MKYPLFHYILLLPPVNPHSASACGKGIDRLCEMYAKCMQMRSETSESSFLCGFPKFKKVQVQLSPFHQINPGDIAQMGERLHGMQEAVGSSPIISITSRRKQELDKCKKARILRHLSSLK